MSEDPYIKEDLIDRANTEKRPGYNREQALENALPDSATIRSEKVGPYQREMAFVIECDGRIWIEANGYGSCTGCDYFLSDPKNWRDDFLRSALCFESVSDVREYLDETDDYYWRGSLKKWAREQLDEIEGDN